MRNTRNFESAWHAEVKNRFSKDYFISDYYPINFVAKDNYVFFNTLYQKESGSTGSNLASKAATWLYGPMRNPTRMFRNKTNSKLSDAIHFLESAAEIEYIREHQFLESFSKRSKEIEEIINQIDPNDSDKYIKLTTALNLAMKGRKRLEIEIENELQRITDRNRRLELDKKAEKEGRFFNVKKGENKYKMTSEEYAERGALKAEDSILGSIDSPYFNLDGKRIFNDMFKNQSDFSVIVERVIVNFGSALIETRANKVHLNKQRTVALIKVLTQEIYNILRIEYADEIKKIKGETRGARRERVAQRLDKLMSEGSYMQQFYDDLTAGPGLEETLDSIAEQNNIPLPSSISTKLHHSTKTLTDRVKKAWEQEKRAGKTNLSYDEWRVEHDLTKNDINELVQIMAEVASKNTKIQLHYTNEGMGATDMLNKTGIAAIIEGGKNTPDDVQAGQLVCEFLYDMNKSEMHNIIDEYLQKARKKFSKARQTVIDNLQRSQVQVEGKESYQKNIKFITALEEEQRKILIELQNDLKTLGVVGAEMLRYINIHETMKGYASINSTTDKFHGAAFGSNIQEQIKVINQMLQDGSITPLDAEWLVFALINCGEGMIGSDNKHALEDYLSAYVGLLMFSDASFIAQDITRYLQSNIATDISHMHLYVLNDKYVPSSYILHLTAEALSRFEHQVEIISTGTILDLSTYTSPNAYATWTPKSEKSGKPWTLYGLSGPAWQHESDEALKETKLTMYFLSTFTNLLHELQAQLSSFS